ncbi:MAG: class I SAM-dependent methyltransferase [Betaproteobacteria bacterium]
MKARTIEWYNDNASQLLSNYESIRSERLHNWLTPFLPETGMPVLDVGAGTGRDAAWLRRLGYRVFAAEPARQMRQLAYEHHGDQGITWIDDRLPELPRLSPFSQDFHLILLSAVWMHLPTEQRLSAMTRLAQLIRPEGVLAISLRKGPLSEERGIFAVSERELVRLAHQHGFELICHIDALDQQGRAEVMWAQMAFRYKT